MTQQHPFDENKLFHTLEKCGFGLEHHVHGLLRRYQWNVINNRNYIDDTTEKEREIDLIAYKYKEVDSVWYFTVLVISCKQSLDSEWAFLTQARKADVNFNYSPIHLVTSDNEHRNMIKNEWDSYVQHAKSVPSLRKLYSSDSRVFANVQFNKDSYKEEGNQRIYSSISSTIKAMEAEKDSHKDTKLEDKPTHYTFYALSVFNKAFIEVQYGDDGGKNVRLVKELKYINRHIVYRKENYYLVHFVSNEILEDTIKTYDEIHEHSTEHFAGLKSKFYTNIWDFSHRIEMINKDFIQDLDHLLHVLLIVQTDLIWPDGQKVTNLSFTHTDEKLTIDLALNVDMEDDVFSFFNNDPKAKKRIGDLLIKRFHYVGDYEITKDWLPF